MERLDAADVGSPRMNAEVLLMFVLGADRAYLYAHPERELTPEEAARYEEVLAQRATGMPSQYITGHQEFWGLDFVVSPAVLIPRPETEHLVEAVLELARGVPASQAGGCGHRFGMCRAGAGARVAGCRSLCRRSLGRSAGNRARQCRRGCNWMSGYGSCSATFSSPFRRKLQLRRCHPERGLQSESRDLLFRLSRDFDFVVSNPPYVAFSEADKVQKSVFEFEPRMAVFAGENGLDVIRPLIEQAHGALKPGGWLALEIGYSMRTMVVNLLSPTMWDDIRVVPDLQGIPRVVAARSVNSETPIALRSPYDSCCSNPKSFICDRFRCASASSAI